MPNHHTEPYEPPTTNPTLNCGNDFAPRPDSPPADPPRTSGIAETTVLLPVERLELIRIGEDEPSLEERSTTVWAKRRERIVRALALGIAFASVEDELVAPLPTFEVSVFPVLQGFAASTSLYPLLFQPARVLGREMTLASSDWMRRIDGRSSDGLRIAETRAIASINERPDPGDSLIDSVICWESLLGTRSETVFRVTSALAKLLESDPSRRHNFIKELKNIYNLRSRLVHGDQVNSDELRRGAVRGKEIAIRALMALYESPEEVLCARDSQARADHLILVSP